LDFGLKHGILRSLDDFHANVTVLPYTTTVDEVLTLDPDGIVISTGPGDPHVLNEQVITLIKVLQTKVPMLAIGLGHELFALANDAALVQLPSEHHGYSHPIQEVVSQRVFYAMQGQGYTVDRATIDREKLFVTHIDLIDDSVQGLRHRDYPAFSVQFFPDAAPGPIEATAIFAEFFETVDDYHHHDDNDD
jgi:carbamoyl-phosphate synthase small subunit